MRLRRVLPCTLALSFAFASAGLAGPKPACNLISDREGDGAHQVAGAVAKSPALDILSADVATGKTEVVAVIRLKSANTTNDPWVKADMSWVLRYKIAGTENNVRLDRKGLTNSVDTVQAEVAGESKTSKLTFKIDGNNLVFSLPRAEFQALKKAKQTLSDFTAVSLLHGGNADTAIGGANKYADLYPSCVKAK